MDITKKKINKKSQLGTTTIVILVIAGFALAFGLSGFIKFVFFTDKTPYIIGGALVLFWLATRRR